MGVAQRVRAFFRERYSLGGLADLATHKTVPVHRHSFWYYWGGMTLALIGIQFASGILLVPYYPPSAHAWTERTSQPNCTFVMMKRTDSNASSAEGR